MLAKGGPYVPKEIPAGLGGTSPTTGGDASGSGCGVDNKADQKATGPTAEAGAGDKDNRV